MNKTKFECQTYLKKDNVMSWIRSSHKRRSKLTNFQIPEEKKTLS